MAREWPWEERKELEKKNWDPTATSLGNEVADFPSACSEPSSWDMNTEFSKACGEGWETYKKGLGYKVLIDSVFILFLKFSIGDVAILFSPPFQLK